ncbi:cytochrome c [Crenobacter sp. SG2305]|uniref:c-type cytochrome n=1 Tax=Crenobacter oryzisoli TaxID=3056844 RepID=UPI0025AA9668|nr:cytochrome c [Crenobacter sp. SG2305]MDN0082752.1 cytochrome c [Crenobacter sp. SG2305]
MKAHSLIRSAGFVGLALALHGTAARADADTDLVKRGEYLARAADCVACHTASGGQPYAGGYGIESPLGTIYSTNITPSKNGGIGNYSEAQFDAALRHGIRADGAHLYPAMPYTSYVKLAPDDVKALYQYFMHGVAPVDGAAKATELPFPFSVRLAMAGWNMLFLDKAPFQPDPAKSVEWNRGAYLVEALEHCSSCHTPRNALMAEQSGQAYAGGALGAWFAPNITADPVSGLGGWSESEVVEYLKTGRVPGKAQAAGPMAEAVEHSLQHLSDADLKAIAVYVKDLPAIRDEHDQQPGHVFGSSNSDEATLRGVAGVSASNSAGGAELFSAVCASCHQPTGGGSKDQYYPSLSHNTTLGRGDTRNLIAVILHGVARKADGKDVFMPGFGADSLVNPLSDQQIADVANYTLKQYGNPALKVSAHDVAAAREGGEPPLLAKLPRLMPWLIGGLIVILGLVAWLFGRRRKG